MTTALIAPMSLGALCEALRAMPATLTPDAAQGRLYVRPMESVTPALAAAIRYWKPELMRALKGAAPCIPFACRCCGAEAVLSPAANCPWCAEITGKAVMIPPSARIEASYLEGMPNREQLSQLSQTDVGHSLGQLPPIPRKSHNARAYGDFSKTALNCPKLSHAPELSLEMAPVAPVISEAIP